MNPQNRIAFRQLVGLRTGDYSELLVRGEVLFRTDDPDGWRDHIRRQARLDRLHVRTGQSRRDPSLVWAVRLHEQDDSGDDAPEFRTLRYQYDVEAVARARSHQLDRWTISHQGRAAGSCATCGARAYVDTTGASPILDGEVLDTDCPGYWSPPGDEPD